MIIVSIHVLYFVTDCLICLLWQVCLAVMCTVTVFKTTR